MLDQTKSPFFFFLVSISFQIKPDWLIFFRIWETLVLTALRTLVILCETGESQCRDSVKVSVQSALSLLTISHHVCLMKKKQELRGSIGAQAFKTLKRNYNALQMYKLPP